MAGKRNWRTGGILEVIYLPEFAKHFLNSPVTLAGFSAFRSFVMAEETSRRSRPEE